jgi:hypothetical protein
MGGTQTSVSRPWRLDDREFKLQASQARGKLQAAVEAAARTEGCVGGPWAKL